MRTTRWDVCLALVIALQSHAQAPSDTLYNSIVEGDAEAITLYLTAGGDPNTELTIPGANTKISLLELAMRSRNEHVALLLLQAGAATSEVGTLIEWAAEVGFADVMAHLLDQDPVRILMMRRESHPLVIAVAHRNRNIVSLLLEKMATIGGYAERQEILDEALIAATGTYDGGVTAELVDDLLKAGASASNTPVLAGAVLKCSPELISVFLAAGADARGQYDAGRGSFTPIEYAVRCFQRGDIPSHTAEAVVDQLIGAGADLCLLARRPSLPARLRVLVEGRCP